MAVTISPTAPAPDPSVAVAGQPITMPHVDQSRPVDPSAATVSDGAEFEVLHDYVGEFSKGSKVKASDFGKGVDIDRLVKLEAIKPLESAPAPSPGPGRPKK